MINVNLLPSSKIDRLRADSKQRRLSAYSILAIALGVALPIILIGLWGGQRALLGLTQRNINKKIDELKQVEDLETVLTVQNQLHALPDLNTRRIYYNTLLVLMPGLMPQNASLSNLELTDSGTISLKGNADSLSTVNDFVSILDRAELRKGNESQRAFNGVTLVQGVPAEQGASFEISLSYDNLLVSKLLEYDLIIGTKVLYQAPQTSSQSEEETPAAESNSTDTTTPFLQTEETTGGAPQ